MAHLFSDAQQERIVAAIRDAEMNTSGEIRVHVQRRVKGDILEAAKQAFQALDMTATAERNGVLFFVALGDRRLAVLGDEGIDARVPPDFWTQIVSHMVERFREGDVTGGLETGIREAGMALKHYFPRQTGDRNELDDSISIAEP